jgi:hypothetical protein
MEESPALGRSHKSGSICQAAGNYDTMRSPDMHDRAAPRTGSLKLTCGKGWSMYFTKKITSRGHGPVSVQKIWDVVKRIRMIGTALGRASRRCGL